MVQRVFEDVPVLCGHRGLGRGVVDGQRENTLGSFRAAVAAGVNWVEVDVRATLDGVLVASHNPTTEDGRAISGLRAVETDDRGLLRIADLLDDLPGQVGVNLEIKSALEDAQRPAGETTAALTADLVNRQRAGRRILATSFDASAPLIVRRRSPGTPVGLLTWIRFPLRKAIPAAVHLGMDVVAPHVDSFRLGETPAAEIAHAVQVAHDAGLQVVAWCPDRAEAQQLIAARVDCLIVDDVRGAVGY
jgi:glycerophosphoryl diester phosphodiesterase